MISLLHCALLRDTFIALYSVFVRDILIKLCISGCYAAGTCMTVSAYSSYSYEDIANAVPQGLRWLQMYIFKDRNLTKDFVRRAETCGYKALVITIDTDPLTMKEGSRCALPIPEGAIAANFKDVCGSSDLLEPCLQWSDIKWLRSITKLPIVLKGIMSTFDARMAVKNGINGIIISNKGGRKLDVLPSTVGTAKCLFIPSNMNTFKRYRLKYNQFRAVVDCGILFFFFYIFQ